jgi:hypothetical protein
MVKVKDYSNSVIYEIKCKNSDVKECYIGSTTNYKQRILNHKSSCNNKNSEKYNYFVYQFIRYNGGWENFEHNILETLCCDNKLELLKKERYYIDLNEDNLNKQIPCKTKKEKYEDNKDKILEKNKKWYENNKNKILEKQKEYKLKNKDKIKEYNLKNKDKIKEWYEQNKDKLHEKFSCNCGGKFTKQNKITHEKTKKHLLYLQNTK